MEQLQACLVCDAPSVNARVVHVRRDDALVRCAQCGLVFANPQYTPEELVDLYRVEYYEAEKNLGTDFRDRDRPVHQALNRAVVRDLLRRYPRLKQRGARVLDYGSGVGFFLEACRELGMTTLGLDFSDVAAEVARRSGIEVRTDPDRTLAGLDDGAYDLVTAWQVIEHLRRPRETLRQLVRVLKPGGILCLAVPSLKALGYRLEGGRWFNITNPTHLSFFNRENLSRMLRELALVRIVRPVFWGGRAGFNPVADLAQYAARWAGLGTELRLYAERPSVS